MAFDFLALGAVAVAAICGAAVAIGKAVSSSHGPRRQATLVIAAALFAVIAAGAALLLWFLWRFTVEFQF